MQYVQVELDRNDEDAIRQLKAASDDEVLAVKPDYFEGGGEVVTLLIGLTGLAIRAIANVAKEHIQSKKHIKIKIKGGVEISGASLADAEKILKLIQNEP